MEIIATMILANLVPFLSLIKVGEIKSGCPTGVHLLKWAGCKIKCGRGGSG